MGKVREIASSVDVKSFWWAVGLSVVGCFMLICSMFIPPLAVIDTSVISAAGLVFTFSGAIVGINGSTNVKLAKFEEEIRRSEKEQETEEKQ